MISPLESCVAAQEYIERVGMRWVGLRKATKVISDNGYEKEVAYAYFNSEGEVKCSSGMEPTDLEAKNIANQIKDLDFPTIETLEALPNSDLPDMIRECEDEKLFIFRNKEGSIEFIETRIILEDGNKKHVPWTYWSDSQWRCCPPEDSRPLYNIEKVRSGDRVFVHEGAKAARAASEISEDHPWQEFLSTGIHLGWSAGTNYVWQNRWRDLRNVPSEIIIIPDNDFDGKKCIGKISREFPYCRVYVLRLDDSFPRSWDIADPLPEEMFSESGYKGLPMRQMLERANWATDEFFVEDKAQYRINEKFAEDMVSIVSMKRYARLSDPEQTWDKEQFNRKFSAFTHGFQDTARLFDKSSSNEADEMTFLPGYPEGLIRHEGRIKLNQYRDRRIEAVQGDTAPFWRFFEYLFPEEFERDHMYRWMATSYGRPDIKMGHAVLMISETQGVGKTTIIDMLARMIGDAHVSYPTDSDLQSDFTGWIVNKRLVAFNEVYAGQSWKVYNRLKSLITDRSVNANIKHQATYNLPLTAHLIAASNSMEALRIDNKDRRWFVPRMPEYLYDDYASLYKWMADGGLKHLAYDMLQFNNVIWQGENAPETQAKRNVIMNSMPADERTLLLTLERLPRDKCITMADMLMWLLRDNTTKYLKPSVVESLARNNGFGIINQSIWRLPQEDESIDDSKIKLCKVLPASLHEDQSPM